MKTKHGNGVATKAIAAKHVIRKGKRVVVLDETEFDRLLRKADLWEPTKPAPDADALAKEDDRQGRDEQRRDEAGGGGFRDRQIAKA